MGELAQTNEKYTACQVLKKHAQNGTKFYAE
jgi:hypothetical protein